MSDPIFWADSGFGTIQASIDSNNMLSMVIGGNITHRGINSRPLYQNSGSGRTIATFNISVQSTTDPTKAVVFPHTSMTKGVFDSLLAEYTINNVPLEVLLNLGVREVEFVLQFTNTDPNVSFPSSGFLGISTGSNTYARSRRNLSVLTSGGSITPVINDFNYLTSLTVNGGEFSGSETFNSVTLIDTTAGSTKTVNLPIQWLTVTPTGFVINPDIRPEYLDLSNLHPASLKINVNFTRGGVTISRDLSTDGSNIFTINLQSPLLVPMAAVEPTLNNINELTKLVLFGGVFSGPAVTVNAILLVLDAGPIVAIPFNWVTASNDRVDVIRNNDSKVELGSYYPGAFKVRVNFTKGSVGYQSDLSINYTDAYKFILQPAPPFRTVTAVTPTLSSANLLTRLQVTTSNTNGFSGSGIYGNGVPRDCTVSLFTLDNDTSPVATLQNIYITWFNFGFTWQSSVHPTTPTPGVDLSGLSTNKLRIRVTYTEDTFNYQTDFLSLNGTNVYELTLNPELIVSAQGLTYSVQPQRTYLRFPIGSVLRDVTYDGVGITTDASFGGNSFLNNSSGFAFTQRDTANVFTIATAYNSTTGYIGSTGTSFSQNTVNDLVLVNFDNTGNTYKTQQNFTYVTPRLEFLDASLLATPESTPNTLFLNFNDNTKYFDTNYPSGLTLDVAGNVVFNRGSGPVLATGNAFTTENTIFPGQFLAIGYQSPAAIDATTTYGLTDQDYFYSPTTGITLGGITYTGVTFFPGALFNQPRYAFVDPTVYGFSVANSQSYVTGNLFVTSSTGSTFAINESYESPLIGVTYETNGYYLSYRTGGETFALPSSAFTLAGQVQLVSGPSSVTVNVTGGVYGASDSFTLRGTSEPFSASDIVISGGTGSQVFTGLTPGTTYTTAVQFAAVIPGPTLSANLLNAANEVVVEGDLTLAATIQLVAGPGSVTVNVTGGLYGTSNSFTLRGTSAPFSASDIVISGGTGSRVFSGLTPGTTYTTEVQFAAVISGPTLSTARVNAGNSATVAAVDSGGGSAALTYTVTNSGSGNYVINSLSNPTLNLVRGVTYTFNINTVGHPFWIQTVPQPYSSANVYNTGVTTNGTQTGTITFNVPLDAPNTLYYASEFNTSMGGIISVSNSGQLTFPYVFAATADQTLTFNLLGEVGPSPPYNHTLTIDVPASTLNTLIPYASNWRSTPGSDNTAPSFQQPVVGLMLQSVMGATLGFLGAGLTGVTTGAYPSNSSGNVVGDRNTSARNLISVFQGASGFTFHESGGNTGITTDFLSLIPAQAITSFTLTPIDITPLPQLLGNNIDDGNRGGSVGSSDFLFSAGLQSLFEQAVGANMIQVANEIESKKLNESPLVPGQFNGSPATYTTYEAAFVGAASDSYTPGVPIYSVQWTSGQELAFFVRYNLTKRRSYSLSPLVTPGSGSTPDTEMVFGGKTFTVAGVVENSTSIPVVYKFVLHAV
jgi:hypothetical protein